MLTAQTVDAVPLDMIRQLAFGLEDPYIVAARHGYTRATFDLLTANDWFNTAVEHRRRELHEAGLTFKAKAGMIAEDLLGHVYTAALKGDVPVDKKLDVLKYMAKLSSLEPRPDAVPTGTGFSITISLPTHGGQQPAATVIEAVPLSSDDPEANPWQPSFAPLVSQLADLPAFIGAAPAASVNLDLTGDLE